MVTTIVEFELPHVMVIVPVSMLPGVAAAKTNGLKVTGIAVPKLYANPLSSFALIIGAKLPPVLMLYAMGESLEVRVIEAVGVACPTVQLMLSVVEPTESLGAGLLTARLKVTGSDA